MKASLLFCSNKFIYYMRIEAYQRTYIEILDTIEQCIKDRRIITSLILLYSAIDSFSALVETDGKKGRKVFEGWVRKWMLAKYPLNCNEVDIYSARCGLLHVQTPESDLSQKKEAKELHYCYGEADTKILQIAIDRNEINAVAIKIEDLVYSFRNGMADCLNDIYQDEQWQKSVKVKSEKFFVNIPK
ncbi:MAG: hypothetical protein QMB24_11435 [Spirosomataceae bacterium]